MLPNEKVLAKMRELYEQGEEIRILTTRNWSTEVFDFVEAHNLPVSEVHFTKGNLKSEMLKVIRSDLHFDDSTDEALNNKELRIRTILVVHPWDRENNPEIYGFEHLE